jgi:hypothetical protein
MRKARKGARFEVQILASGLGEHRLREVVRFLDMAFVERSVSRRQRGIWHVAEAFPKISDHAETDSGSMLLREGLKRRADSNLMPLPHRTPRARAAGGSNDRGQCYRK